MDQEDVSVDVLAAALVREWLARKGLREILARLDAARPIDATDVSTRVALVAALKLEGFVRRSRGMVQSGERSTLEQLLHERNQVTRKLESLKALGDRYATSSSFQLGVEEIVSAQFNGSKLVSFKAVGEVHALQLPAAAENLGATTPTPSFDFTLENAEKTQARWNLPSMQVNARVMHRLLDTEPHVFRARLCLGAEGSKVPLMRYESEANWAPIPLKVIPQWSVDHTRGKGRLIVLVLANPNLKQGLRHISIHAVVPAAEALLVAEPPAGWYGEREELIWSIDRLHPETTPRKLMATLRGSSPGSLPQTPQPLRVFFSCDGSTLTNLSPRPTASDEGRVVSSEVLRHFASGKYEVAVTTKPAT
eukprot:CAMPEP_0183339592 /NCGR_PEP_ID=MMETSP0164_2-20130417/6456_1 /TAXON_ID=221442 /ORGANISM="Coccolithus pelagicus ssp braarudi, Strain PLY182g" /LENGTH=364 /DNA_ID=CAMNT_0025509601 /DNA_START=30 /DNA_END=1124 /DNA_ORIENTATION=-